MSVLSGRLIQSLGIINPCVSRQERTYGGGVVLSHGLGPVSYDVTVEFDLHGVDMGVNLASGDFILASTIEHFTMPWDVCGIVHDKSSWARRGLAVQNTFLDAGWKGHLTLELSNHSKQTLYISRGMPIAQIVFHRIEEPDMTQVYNGKYQNQSRGPVRAR